MKGIFALLFVTLICGSQVRAGTPKVEAAIAKDTETKPTDTFTADVPKLYAFFKTHGTKKGDTLRGVWIADDVGDAAPKNTKIDEASITGDQDDFTGAYSLSKPTKGWPVGKYHIDIYVGDDVATSVKFTIKAADSAAESDDDNKKTED